MPLTITRMNWLILLREILVIPVSSESQAKPIKLSTFCGYNVELILDKLDGTCSYHWVLKSYGVRSTIYFLSVLVLYP
jgi:hypothetical protein